VNIYASCVIFTYDQKLHRRPDLPLSMAEARIGAVREIFHGLLHEMDGLCEGRQNSAYIRRLMPRYRTRGMHEELYDDYRFPVVFQNAMSELLNERESDRPGFICSILLDTCANRPRAEPENTMPLSHRVDDWMLECMMVWQRAAGPRGDRLDRLGVMRVERMRCAEIMQRHTSP